MGRSAMSYVRLAAPFGGGLLLLTSAAAWPQPAPAVHFGAPIAGLCVFDQARALAQSQAGTSVTQQMQQFAAGVLAELDAQHRAIERDDQALAAQKTTLKPADFERNLTLLRQRYAALDHTRQTRLGQLSTTRKAADGLVASALDPSLAAATTDRKCAIVVDRAATHGFNPAQTGGEWPLSRLGGDRLSSEAG